MLWCCRLGDTEGLKGARVRCRAESDQVGGAGLATEGDEAVRTLIVCVVVCFVLLAFALTLEGAVAVARATKISESVKLDRREGSLFERESELQVLRLRSNSNHIYFAVLAGAELQHLENRMAENPIEEFYNVDLAKLNMFGCGLVLTTSFCCCGGIGVEWVMLGEMFPNGAWVPKLLFLIPIFGAALMFVAGRSILSANGISIYRGKRKKKRRKKQRQDADDDDDRDDPPRRSRRSPRGEGDAD